MCSEAHLSNTDFLAYKRLIWMAVYKDILLGKSGGGLTIIRNFCQEEGATEEGVYSSIPDHAEKIIN